MRELLVVQRDETLDLLAAARRLRAAPASRPCAARGGGVCASRQPSGSASARAASNDAGSFSSVSAWSGVFVRTRRTVQNSRLVASNVMKLGYGDVRRQKV